MRSGRGCAPGAGFLFCYIGVPLFVLGASFASWGPFTITLSFPLPFPSPPPHSNPNSVHASAFSQSSPCPTTPEPPPPRPPHTHTLKQCSTVHALVTFVVQVRCYPTKTNIHKYTVLCLGREKMQMLRARLRPPGSHSPIPAVPFSVPVLPSMQLPLNPRP